MRRFMRSVGLPILLMLAFCLAALGCAGEPQNCVGNEGICADNARCNEETGECEAVALEGCAGLTVCGAGTLCDEETGQCVLGTLDCRTDDAVCQTGTTCDVSTGRCAADAVDCRADAALCGVGTSCDAGTGLCIADDGDCRQDAALCGTGTICCNNTGKCLADDFDCRDDADICGAGTSCCGSTGKCLSDFDCGDNVDLCGAGTSCCSITGKCLADDLDCRDDADLCGAGSSCCNITGKCLVSDFDCRDDENLCGPGSICGGDGTCRADCRLNIAGICGNGMLCSHRTGACEIASVLDCNVVTGMCWEDQVCDVDTGYCRESWIDSTQPFDVQVYDLSMDIRTMTKTFEATLNLFFVATRTTTSIDLHVGKIKEMECGRQYNPYVVSEVNNASGESLMFLQNPAKGILTVNLGETLERGNGMVITILYSGQFNPVDGFNAGLMMSSGKNGNDVILTMGWPDHARNWLPSNDHPSDGARFIADIGIDNHFMVLSNGIPVKERTEEDLRRRTFVLRQPVPTYSLSITASDFVKVPLGVVDGVSVDAYMYPDDAHIPPIFWSDTLGALRYLNATLGQYAFETYGMVQFPSYLGGMEHATIVSISDTAVDAPHRGARVVVHELIHGWFGNNARQASWEEFWLNESLAEFLDAEHRGVQQGPAAYMSRMENRRGWLMALPSWFDTYPLRYSFDVATVPSFNDSTGNAPYIKGPWVWHMLRELIGKETFGTLLWIFYSESRFNTYDTEFLVALTNSVAGRDLTWFFDEWVYQRGWPQIEYMWGYEEGELTVKVDQVQEEGYGVYTFVGNLALDFHFEGPDDTCVVTVTMSGGERGGASSIKCAFEPSVEPSTPFYDRVLVQMM